VILGELFTEKHHPMGWGWGWGEPPFACASLFCEKGLPTISSCNRSQWMCGDFVGKPAGFGTLSPFLGA
jgi:hypothetical protein